MRRPKLKLTLALSHLREVAFDAEARFRVEIRYLPIGETRSFSASFGASLC